MRRKQKKVFIIFLILSIFFINLLNCFQKEKKDNRNNIIIGSLLYVNSQKKSGGDYNCNTSPSPLTFAEFKTSIDTLNTSSLKCSECHGINTAQANFIITNYSSVIERVISGNPNGSVLYFKVKPGGAMNAYSNSKVNQAIYCWIEKGANP